MKNVDIYKDKLFIKFEEKSDTFKPVKEHCHR